MIFKYIIILFLSIHLWSLAYNEPCLCLENKIEKLQHITGKMSNICDLILKLCEAESILFKDYIDFISKKVDELSHNSSASDSFRSILESVIKCILIDQSNFDIFIQDTTELTKE